MFELLHGHARLTLTISTKLMGQLFDILLDLLPALIPGPGHRDEESNRLALWVGLFVVLLVGGAFANWYFFFRTPV